MSCLNQHRNFELNVQNYPWNFTIFKISLLKIGLEAAISLNLSNPVVRKICFSFPSFQDLLKIGIKFSQTRNFCFALSCCFLPTSSPFLHWPETIRDFPSPRLTRSLYRLWYFLATLLQLQRIKSSQFRVSMIGPNFRNERNESHIETPKIVLLFYFSKIYTGLTRKRNHC